MSVWKNISLSLSNRDRQTVYIKKRKYQTQTIQLLFNLFGICGCFTVCHTQYGDSKQAILNDELKELLNAISCNSWKFWLVNTHAYPNRSKQNKNQLKHEKKIRNLNCHSQNEDIEKLNANNHMKRMQIL